jgi:hypothetical protein
MVAFTSRKKPEPNFPILLKTIFDTTKTTSRYCNSYTDHAPAGMCSDDNGHWGGVITDWVTSYKIYAGFREGEAADQGTYDVSEPSDTESESGGDSESKSAGEDEGEDKEEAAVSRRQDSM